MVDRPESCPACGRYTERGKQQLAVESRSRPIYGTDFSKPLSEIVAGIRSDLVKARGQISDVQFGYTGWSEHLACVEGLLTCGVIALYGVIGHMKEAEARRAEEAVTQHKGTE